MLQMESWGTLKFLEIFGPKNVYVLTLEKEEAIKGVSRSAIKVASFGLISFGVGAFTQLPYGLINANFNEGPDKIAAATLAIASGLSVYALSTFNSLMLASERRLMGNTEKSIKGLQKELASLIIQNRESFNYLPLSQKGGVIESFQKVRNIKDLNEKLGLYFDMVFAEVEHAPEPYPLATRVIDKGGIGGGVVATVTQIVGLSWYSFSNTNIYLKNAIVAGFVLGGVLVSTGYVTQDNCVRTIKGVANLVFRTITFTNIKGTSEQLYPKAVLTLKLAEIVVAGLFQPTVYVAWNSFFETSDYAVVRDYFPGAMVASTFLMFIPAFFYFTDLLVRQVAITRGSEEAKAILKLQKELTKLSEFLNNLSTVNFCVAALGIKKPVVEKMLAKYNLSVENSTNL